MDELLHDSDGRWYLRFSATAIVRGKGLNGVIVFTGFSEVLTSKVNRVTEQSLLVVR